MTSAPSADGLGDRGVVGDASVDQVAVADAHRGEHRGDGGAGEDRVDGVARGEHDLFPTAHVGRDDVDGDLGVLELVEGDVVADEPPKRAVRAQRRCPTHGRGAEASRLQREDVSAAEPGPDGGQLVQRFRARAVAGDVGGVERARRGADHQVRFDPSGGEGLEHAHLDRSEAPATRQHECGDHVRRLRHGRGGAVERGGEPGQGQRGEQEPEVAQGDVVEVGLQEQVDDDPGEPGGDEVAAELRAGRRRRARRRSR